MNEGVYYKLAKVLDTMPNGFPSTDTGVEIKILKKIFTPEEAELFCDLKMHFESAEEIAARTGRPVEAIRLIHKTPEEIQHPPKDVAAWNEERARQRGVDYSEYK